ncbi:MAG: hypothetical protein A3F68_12385 [Acidobacteria bacterium RIFCSPLOWO2_12_FULL_54_10]|nr:MAG: hypothetical protein A3F68_12385 [Acidobacteria bacterium RIFCSPLOWO2_12_FULL_54_10]
MSLSSHRATDGSPPIHAKDSHFFSYSLYGITLRSEWKLPYAECLEPRPPIVEMLKGESSVFHSVALQTDSRSDRQPDFDYRRLDDGSHYFCWRDLYEFLVPPDGHRIIARFFPGASQESFLPYLAVGGLSFCLLKQGIDPLHATAVAVNDRAVGFLGKSGYGKSSLASAFVRAGYPVLTDDLLVLRKDLDDFLAYPGPPHIKLSGEIAVIDFREQLAGIEENPRTQKVTIPLNPQELLRTTVPLKTLYLLNRPRSVERMSTITIRRLSQRRALLTLIRNSFNDWVTDTARLKLQLHSYAQVASQVPVKLLSYPRRAALLESVRDAILEDFGR